MFFGTYFCVSVLGFVLVFYIVCDKDHGVHFYAYFHFVIFFEVFSVFLRVARCGFFSLSVQSVLVFPLLVPETWGLAVTCLVFGVFYICVAFGVSVVYKLRVLCS